MVVVVLGSETWSASPIFNHETANRTEWETEAPSQVSCKLNTLSPTDTVKFIYLVMIISAKRNT